MSRSSPKMVSPILRAPRTKKEERPTHQSLEAVRLAEEEALLAVEQRDRPTAAPPARPPSDIRALTISVPPEPEPFNLSSSDEAGWDAAFSGLSLQPEPEPEQQLELIEVHDDEEPQLELEEVHDDEPQKPITPRDVPRLLASNSELSKLPMDPRAGFLLGNVDGVQTVEEIGDICAMPEQDVVELLGWLRDLGVIAV